MTLVRPLVREDEAAWRRLWDEYLAFYNTDLSAAYNSALFDKLLSDQGHFGLTAERNGVVIGFVHFLPHASTWSDTGYCYLEDLYVDASARGTGAGRALIEAVAEEARRRGLNRVYWHTEKDNTVARRLYDKLATLSDFVQYRR